MWDQGWAVFNQGFSVGHWYLVQDRLRDFTVAGNYPIEDAIRIIYPERHEAFVARQLRRRKIKL